jgi:peptidoglycan-associated lipoprotein
MGSKEDFVVNVGDRVFFDFDKFDLKPEAQATLKKQAAWLQKYPSVAVTVEGHADERGTREYNLALGERRANSVKDYLSALGIARTRINIISYGKERPVALGHDEAAWSQNRRAVTTLTSGAAGS